MQPRSELVRLTGCSEAKYDELSFSCPSNLRCSDLQNMVSCFFLAESKPARGNTTTFLSTHPTRGVAWVKGQLRSLLSPQPWAPQHRPAPSELAAPALKPQQQRLGPTQRSEATCLLWGRSDLKFPAGSLIPRASERQFSPRLKFK